MFGAGRFSDGLTNASVTGIFVAYTLLNYIIDVVYRHMEGKVLVFVCYCLDGEIPNKSRYLSYYIRPTVCF